ncbi:MAG: amidohydrolase family protein, partial [Dehalococcoidia bacterium]
MDIKPIDIHIHPFTEATRAGHGPSYTEAHDQFFGRSPEAPHHGKTSIPIEETYQTFQEAGIERAVLVNMVSPTRWGTIFPNDELASYCARYPDLFIGFAGVDPYQGELAVREGERAVKELGCRGLKFHPAYQDFNPADLSLMGPIYQKCVELDIAILVHTGTTRMTRCNIEYCRPLCLDNVATAFPQLRIIMTHFGWPWTEEALAVVWRHENVYLDLSGWLPRYVYATQPIVFQYMNTVLQDKFVFGSDYPAINPAVWIKDFDAIVESGYTWA